MKRKKGFSGGFFQGMNLQARLSEVSFLSLLLKYKEEKKYIEDGYEAWPDFCNEELGISDETLRIRFKTLSICGPETTRAMVGLGFAWKDIRAIDNALSDDQRKELKKGVLLIDDKKIPVNEEHSSDIQSAVDLLIARADAAVKGEKLASNKLGGIDKEHKKEIKAMQQEITDLKAQVISPETPEEFDEVFKLIERKVNEIVIAAKRLKFDEAHKDVAEGPIKGKYKMRINTLETQFTNLVDSLNEAILG